jgi:hypothetical protein
MAQVVEHLPSKCEVLSSALKISTNKWYGNTFFTEIKVIS